MKTSFLYGNYVKNLHDKFIRRLDDIEAEFNFDYGDEFEIAICEILRSFLPQKFGICRGFVVDSKGNTAGDDIIIYDQERFPTLKLVHRNDYARKEKIPIEAVYAYIEAKHNFAINDDPDKCVLRKAIIQCSSVKKICSQRTKTELYQNDPYLTETNRKITQIDWLPTYRNPVLGIIISRHVSNQKEKLTDENEINSLLHAIPLEMNPHFPDLIIAGRHNMLCPAYNTGEKFKSTLFMLTDKNYGADVLTRNDLSYGIGLAHLFAALDWIRLGRMPWSDILNDAKKDDYTPQNF